MKEEKKQRDMWETVSTAVNILHVGIMNLENEFVDQYYSPPAKREAIRKAYSDMEEAVENIKFLNYLLEGLVHPSRRIKASQEVLEGLEKLRTAPHTVIEDEELGPE